MLTPNDLRDFEFSLDEWYLFAERTRCHEQVVIDFVMSYPSRFALTNASDLLRLSNLVQCFDPEEPIPWDAVTTIVFHGDVQRSAEFRRYHEEWLIVSRAIADRQAQP